MSEYLDDGDEERKIYSNFVWPASAISATGRDIDITIVQKILNFGLGRLLHYTDYDEAIKARDLSHVKTQLDIHVIGGSTSNGHFNWVQAALQAAKDMPRTTTSITTGCFYEMSIPDLGHFTEICEEESGFCPDIIMQNTFSFGLEELERLRRLRPSKLRRLSIYCNTSPAVDLGFKDITIINETIQSFWPSLKEFKILTDTKSWIDYPFPGQRAISFYEDSGIPLNDETILNGTMENVDIDLFELMDSNRIPNLLRYISSMCAPGCRVILGSVDYTKVIANMRE